ncbi:unnamed protein product (macronuclear) [Paramecium tetraurelia]|uniref:Serine aminopeptidase S33 domain-containing protein n=1 Tax=Paramecium tetraurelia TaxID=5888 RepID=A0CQK4_PARTE|nr:uncharacterized protein GSPATT00009419001 [Paramecium tetraurelia]CAK73071.1 unnamed protein product [Paramecium tetraurelia]|eukprot:XP_001440468.1 hypothetical protein (macronuclear) [Paramecium tetraurelia strain d4-2]
MKYFQNGLNQICQQIIRPARAEYTIYDLSSYQIQEDSQYTREDFDIINPRQEVIKVSQYIGQQKSDVCIIYLHTANGSRMEVSKYVSMIIKNGFALISFDFTGSGMSDGEIVTYGHREVGDLQTVINHFKSSYKQIILWGRSMGSAVALQYMQKFNNILIKGMILDSPFVCLLDVILQMASSKTKIPNFILKSLSTFVSNELKKQAGFDLEEINCLKKISSIKCPAIFVTSKLDTIVPPEQTEKLFKAYTGIKQIQYTNQQHNGIRDHAFIETLIQWFKKRTPIFERLGVGTQIKQRIMHKQKNTLGTIKQVSLDLYKERSSILEYQRSLNTSVSPRQTIMNKQKLTAEEKYNQMLETQRSLYLDRSVSAKRIQISNSIDYQISPMPLAPLSNKIVTSSQHNYFSHSKPITFTKIPHKTKDCTQV